MTGSDARHGGLTMGNLEVHNHFLDQILVEAPVPWVEKVIKDEQVHLFYSSTQSRILEPRSPEDILLDIERLTTDTTLMPDARLRIFEPPQGMCLESPLERFLTPGECSTPSYFAGPALEQMGFRMGNMNGKYARKQRARENVRLVIGNSHQGVTSSAGHSQEG